MKRIIITALMMTIVSPVFAFKSEDCGAKIDSLRSLSSTAEEIQTQTANDERVPIDRTSSEYKELNAIGVVTLPKMKSYGSGFLVDDCHVLTNKHVVFLKLKNVKKNAKVAFSVGHPATKEEQFSHTLIDGKVIAYGNYDSFTTSLNGDWAVIRLSEPVGKKVGSIPLYQMAAIKMLNRSVITAGFPGSKTQNGKDLSQLWADLNCTLLGMSIYSFEYHTCQATGGQSGSPIMSKGNDGVFYAIGMISGDRGFSLDRITNSDKANMAVSFESGKPYDVVSDGDKIIEAIKADKCD